MSDKHISDSDQPVSDAHFRYKKPKSFFPESSAERTTALGLLALLLFLAFGLGYLVAANKLSSAFIFRYDLHSSFLWFIFRPEIFMPCLIFLVGLIIIKGIYNARSYNPTWLAHTAIGLGIAILVGCTFFASNNTQFTVTCGVCLLYALYTVAIPPLWLTIPLFLLYGIGAYITKGIGIGVLIGLLAIGLSLYPRGISIKRFIYPKRGVI